MTDISLRIAGPNDLPFVFATWLRAYRYSSDLARGMTDKEFYKTHHPVVDSIIVSGAQIDLAVLPDDPNTILGYMVSSAGALHFVYVKKPFRQMGIASRLLGLLPLEVGQYSYRTHDTPWILKKRKLTYNPYAALVKNGTGATETAKQ